MISFTCAAAGCVEAKDKMGNKGEGLRLLH